MSDDLSCPVDGLIDELRAYYVDWRHEAAAVVQAYTLWSEAPPADAQSRFSAYLAALDREEFAALTYARVVAEVERALCSVQWSESA